LILNDVNEFTWQKIRTVDPEKIKLDILDVNFSYQNREIYDYFCHVHAKHREFNIGLLTLEFVNNFLTCKSGFKINRISCSFNLESFKIVDLFEKCLRRISCQYLEITFSELVESPLVDLITSVSDDIEYLTLINETDIPLILNGSSRSQSYQKRHNMPIAKRGYSHPWYTLVSKHSSGEMRSITFISAGKVIIKPDAANMLNRGCSNADAYGYIKTDSGYFESLYINVADTFMQSVLTVIRGRHTYVKNLLMKLSSLLSLSEVDRMMKTVSSLKHLENVFIVISDKIDYVKVKEFLVNLNTICSRDKRHVIFRYFFTRKLKFVLNVII